MWSRQHTISQEVNRLNNLGKADKGLQANTEGFQELRRLIIKHGLNNDVAITLLHKHYRLKPGEVNVGQMKEGEITTTPRKIVSTGSIPWLWKSVGKGKIDWLPVQYIKEPSSSKTLAKRAKKLSHCVRFWTEATKVIQRYHLADILGLALILNGPIALSDFRILSEDTDIYARRSITRLIDRQPEQSKGVYTLWTVAEGTDPPPSTICGQCKREKKTPPKIS